MKDQTLFEYKKAYFEYIDSIVEAAVRRFIQGESISNDMLKIIRELYNAANAEKDFKNESFETAYHNPVTGDVEFLFSRFFYLLSIAKKLKWKVYLRRQIRKVAPDIRIELEGNTLAIIEIKSKVGWMQPFFSDDRVQSDLKRLEEGKSNFDPYDDIREKKEQLWKYIDHFGIKSNNFFVLVPSLKQAYRKKHNREFSYFKTTFARNADLKQDNLVVLSNDLKYEASGEAEPASVTHELEDMVKKILELSSQNLTKNCAKIQAFLP